MGAEQLCGQTPQVGKYYLVACVQDPSRDADEWFPVFGTRHKDAEIAPSTPWEHYHFDWRFIGDRLVRSAFGKDPSDTEDMALALAHVRWIYDDGPLEVRQMRKRCVREMPTFPVTFTFYAGPQKLTCKVEALCAGKRIDPANPICPHRGLSLNGLPIDTDGCVICPGHGLRFSMATGEMVSRYSEEMLKSMQGSGRVLSHDDAERSDCGHGG